MTTDSSLPMAPRLEWLTRATRNYGIVTGGAVVVSSLYVWLNPLGGVGEGLGDVMASRLFIVPMQLVVLGLPSVVLISPLFGFAKRTPRPWTVRLLAFLLTFWIPPFLALLMADPVDLVVALAAQAAVAATLPLPRGAMRARKTGPSNRSMGPTSAV